MANAPVESVTATRVRLLSANISRESCPLRPRTCLTLSRNTRRMSADRTGVLSRLLIIRPTKAAVGARTESGCCAWAFAAAAIIAQLTIAARRNRIGSVYSRSRAFATLAICQERLLMNAALDVNADQPHVLSRLSMERLDDSPEPPPCPQGHARSARAPRPQLDADARIRDRLLAGARREPIARPR